MPTIATRGGASARGFGFSGIKTNVTSQTFTSSTTWVAPVGVTSLLVVIGKGQDGASSGQGQFVCAFTGVSNESGTQTGPYSLPIAVSAVYSNVQACVDEFNIGGYRSAAAVVDRQFRFFQTQTYTFSDTYPFGTGTFPYITIANTWRINGSPSSGTAQYVFPTFGYNAEGDIIYPGSAGANTTGFGYTFTGGTVSGSYPNQTGSPASPAAYTNVAVTPGASYSLSIPDNGYITIQYLS